MCLRGLQAEFQSSLLSGERDFIRRVVGANEAEAAARLDVYRNAYRLRLREALQVDYPKLELLLGDEAFAGLCDDYIAAYPSHHPSLRWFGRAMADFLINTAPYRDQPVLSEMAAFEWAQGLVFDASDRDVLDENALVTLTPEDWPGLRLTAHPGVRRLDLEWNVPPIWRALEDDRIPPFPLRGPRSQSWLLWRRDLAIHWRSLTPDEAWAIDAWRDGACFAELCEGLCAWMEPEVVALNAAGMLRGWLREGLVAEVESILGKWSDE